MFTEMDEKSLLNNNNYKKIYKKKKSIFYKINQ